MPWIVEPPESANAIGRSEARNDLPVGSVPIVIVSAASLTAKVPGVTCAALATCFSGTPSTKTWSGSAAIGLVALT